MINEILKKYYPLGESELTENLIYHFQRKRLYICKLQSNYLEKDFMRFIEVLQMRYKGNIFNESILNPDDPSIRLFINLNGKNNISIQIVISLLADYATFIISLVKEDSSNLVRFFNDDDFLNKDFKFIHDTFVKFFNFQILSDIQLNARFRYKSNFFDFFEPSLYELLFGRRYSPL
ncbi:hypothetical protein [Pararhodonellum marinum]|uniref:hypothetical protein n=1 Tax=Pararhodonellum marinum TaxID=2755358 RepID=UPI00188F63C2|nr:hypothetical protein [Pararhodonellum marinum]